MTDKLIFSEEAENAVIGAVLIDPALVDLLPLEAAHFYQTKCRVIYETVKRMRRAEKPVDMVTLAEELDSTKKLEEAGGPGALAFYVSETFYTYNAAAYADVILDKARRRKMVLTAHEIYAAAVDDAKQPDDVISKGIDDLSQASSVVKGAVHWDADWSGLVDEIGERIENPKEIYGIPTGFADLDKVTGGLQRGEYWLLSGEPGVGKSIMAMQMAMQLAKSAPGALYSVEMSGRQVLRRLASGAANVSVRDMKRGKVSDLGGLYAAIEQLAKLPVYMSDDISWTTTSLRADLMRLKVQHGIEWFVLDYLYLLNDGAGMNEIERTTQISKGLKSICKALELGGVIIHSMNKMGMSAAVPGQENLRGSGQVIYDADLIMFMTEYKEMAGDYIPPEDHANMRNIYFGKGRELEDPRKYLYLVQRPGFPAFADYDWSKRDVQTMSGKKNGMVRDGNAHQPRF